MPDLSRENESFSFGLSLNCIEYIHVHVHVYNTIIVRDIFQNLVENLESGAAQGRPARARGLNFIANGSGGDSGYTFWNDFRCD